MGICRSEYSITKTKDLLTSVKWEVHTRRREQDCPQISRALVCNGRVERTVQQHPGAYRRQAAESSGSTFGKAEEMILFDRRQYRSLLREARRVAHDGSEVCGLLVDTKVHLALVRTRNVSRRAGNFQLSAHDTRQITRAAKVLSHEVVGGFHSHPAYFAKPGPSDIANAVDGSLMLILDCIGNEGALWRIRHGQARRVKFGFVQDRRGSRTSR